VVLLCFPLVVIIAVAAILLPGWLRDRPLHHLGVVQEGVLYRGGQPDAENLDALVSTYKIKTIVNLRGADVKEDWYRTERDFCERRGVRLIDLPFGKPDRIVSELKEFLSVATDKANWPVFAHCEAGSVRTGYAVASYRIAVQGWTYEQALAEAREFRFDPLKINPTYDTILRELAGGADWHNLKAPATSASAPAE